MAANVVRQQRKPRSTELVTSHVVRTYTCRSARGFAVAAGTIATLENGDPAA